MRWLYGSVALCVIGHVLCRPWRQCGCLHDLQSATRRTPAASKTMAIKQTEAWRPGGSSTMGAMQCARLKCPWSTAYSRKCVEGFEERAYSRKCIKSGFATPLRECNAHFQPETCSAQVRIDPCKATSALLEPLIRLAGFVLLLLLVQLRWLASAHRIVPATCTTTATSAQCANQGQRSLVPYLSRSTQ